MPIVDILIVSAIVCAFLAFAVTLAWGQYHTRGIDAARRPASAKAHVAALKRGAQDTPASHKIAARV